MERHAWWTRPLPASAAVFAVGVLCFLPALWNGFVWDDINVLIISDKLHDPSAMWNVFRHPAMWSTGLPVGEIGTYRPIPLATFVVDYQLWGLSAVGYHASSLLFHGLACVAVYTFVRRFTGAALPALIVALLCAVHPTAVESAGWINGRSELLALAFGACALAVLARPVRSGGAVLAGLLLLASVLSKETGAVFFPIAAGLSGSGGIGRERQWCRPALAPLLAIAVATAVYLFARNAALGSDASPSSFQPLEVLAAVPAVWARALQTVFLPLEAVPVTLQPWLSQMSGLELAVYSLFAVIVLVGVLVAWRRRRLDILLPAALWLGALMPTALLAISDWPGLYRWLTIPLPGLFLVVFALIPQTLSRRVLASVLIAYGCVCILLTQRALPKWRTSTAFYQALIEQEPSHYWGYRGLGTNHMNQGRWKEAAFLLGAALERGSKHPGTSEQFAVAASKLGHCKEAIPILTTFAGTYVPPRHGRKPGTGVALFRRIDAPRSATIRPQGAFRSTRQPPRSDGAPHAPIPWAENLRSGPSQLREITGRHFAGSHGAVLEPEATS